MRKILTFPKFCETCIFNCTCSPSAVPSKKAPLSSKLYYFQPPFYLKCRLRLLAGESPVSSHRQTPPTPPPPTPTPQPPLQPPTPLQLTRFGPTLGAHAQRGVASNRWAPTTLGSFRARRCFSTPILVFTHQRTAENGVFFLLESFSHIHIYTFFFVDCVVTHSNRRAKADVIYHISLSFPLIFIQVGKLVFPFVWFV